MGMFSWVCKGCGQELVQGELVRLNGQKQTYDGYGGSAANEGDYDPSAWHDRCYLKATPEAKLDETPSKHALNQGFGSPKLEFLPRFKDDGEIKYTATVYCGHQVGEDKYTDYEMILTKQGKLEDQKAYRKKYDEVAESAEFDYDAWMKLTDQEKEANYAEHQRHLESLVGGPMPERNAAEFSSIDEAIAAVDAVLERDVPGQCEGAYQFVVFGSQKGTGSGSVFERIVEHRWDRSSKNYQDWVRLPGLVTKITYRK